MKKIFISLLAGLVIIVAVVAYGFFTNLNKPIFHTIDNGITSVVFYVESYDGQTLTLPAYDSNNLLITSIHEDAFQKGDFSKVRHLVLPDGVTELTVGCFSNFTSLEKVTLGSGLTTFNNAAFEGTSLTQVILKDDNTQFEFIDNCLVSKDINNSETILWWGDHIPDTVTTVGQYAFYNRDIKVIDIPASVNRIEDYAFYGCSEITTLDIPGSVLYIGDYAFANCTSLQSVTVGEGVRTIADYVFSGCNSLASVTIPDSTDEIGKFTFKNTALSEIPNLGSVTHLSTGLFSGCDRMVGANIPQGVQSMGLEVFSLCSSLKSVHFPSTLRLIEGHDTFWMCNSLNEITVAEGNLNYYAENNCLIDRETMTLVAGTNSSDVPDGTVIIGEGALALQNQLINVSIPDSVKKIEQAAFSDSKQLRTLYIPASVTEVGSKIVGGNAEEMHIYCGAVSKPNGWEENWNNADYPITWGVSREEYEEIVQ